MKFTSSTAVVALVGALPALSQGLIPALPSEIFGLSFSPQCQAAVIGLFTNSSLAQCFPVTDLLPILTSNTSVVPVLDNFMSDLCYNYPPCSNATLTSASAAVIAGCGSDLRNESIPDTVISTIFNLYPVIREVLCLKTVDPYTAESYGGFLGAPPIPITTPPYNGTNGTFCVTSFLTQLSAYFEANLTVPYVASIISGTNTTALQLLGGIQPNIVCNDCIFGAFEVVEAAYPIVGQIPVQTLTNLVGVNGSILGNTTFNQQLDGVCAYQNLSVSTNGTLPANISVSIINSTYPFTLTNGKETFSPVALVKRLLFGRKVQA